MIAGLIWLETFGVVAARRTEARRLWRRLEKIVQTIRRAEDDLRRVQGRGIK